MEIRDENIVDLERDPGPAALDLVADSGIEGDELVMVVAVGAILVLGHAVHAAGGEPALGAK